MNLNDIKKNCERYLRAKYEYYILCKPKMLDADFDRLEAELKATKNQLALTVTGMVDFPTIREIKELGFDLGNIIDSQYRDETKYPHLTPMLSLQKIQVNDETQMPLHDVELFLDRVPAETIEATAKYDGNGIETIYQDGQLVQALTRGQDKKFGLDKTIKMKHLAPLTIALPGTVEVRGEIVIDVKLWERRYSDPNEVDNPRNFVAGVLNRDEYNIADLQDLVYVAYSLVVVDAAGKKTFPANSQALLKELGFNQKYDPFKMVAPATTQGFLDIYWAFKHYREHTCPYLLDGIVIKFPEKFRPKLGENNHHPKWAVAIKFPPSVVSTYIEGVEWTMGKNGDFTPVALLKPVELDGVVITRASMHNLGYIVNNQVFPGAKVAIAKRGEIIPQIVGILQVSPHVDAYMQEYDDFVLECKKRPN